MEDIPEDEDKCSAWLHKLYQEKVGVPAVCRAQDAATGGTGRTSKYIVRWPLRK